ncbi:hypothetical protein ES703_121542 [subsurface metagenome]
MVAELTITAKNVLSELESAGPVGQAHSYSDVRNAANATSITGNYTTVGQSREGHAQWPYYQWFMWRGGLFFNTLELAGKEILSAKLILHEAFGGAASAIAHPEVQWLVIVPGGDLNESGLVVADYGELIDDIIYYGSITGTDWVAYGDEVDVPIDLTAAGLAAINKSGWTKFGLRGRKDILNIGDETGIMRNRFDFKAPDHVTVAERPRLVITYQPPPTVTTDPATGVGPVSATLNATLVDDGGEPCECRFEWGLDPSYGVTTPIQVKTTGQTFSYVIHDLVPGTAYHFRAMATNSVGTSCGADRSFSTKPIISKAYALAREEL